jgi:hypothetical protein
VIKTVHERLLLSDHAAFRLVEVGSMLSLMLAILICLLAPWLPVLIYRSLPRRSPPPPGAAQLHQLAGALQQPGPEEVVDAVFPEEEPLSADLTRQPTSHARKAQPGDDLAASFQPPQTGSDPDSADNSD